jgi:uncharacterized protein with gpF-like domain
MPLDDSGMKISHGATQIESEIINAIPEIIRKIDKDQKELAQFYDSELEKSKRFLDQEDFYLITRVLSIADSYVNQLTETEVKAIYNILKKHKCNSNPHLLTSMAVLRYILNSLISNAQENELNIDKLSKLIDNGFGKYKKFEAMW